MKSHTCAIHGGYRPEEQTGATVPPIFQTVSYAYRSAEELAQVFEGTAPGYIYTRIANPTTYALERRLAELEAGVGCLACSSGTAAIAVAAMGLLRCGDHILSAAGIFGGTASLFRNTLGRFGIETTFADASHTQQFAENLRKNTRMIFVETIGNPKMDVPDIPAIAELAKKAGIPLLVDSTLTTPILVQPGQWGADLVVHSTSKFINGSGNSIGGALIDTGNFAWQEGPFDDIKKLALKAGQLAFLAQSSSFVGVIGAPSYTIKSICDCPTFFGPVREIQCGCGPRATLVSTCNNRSPGTRPTPMDGSNLVQTRASTARPPSRRRIRRILPRRPGDPQEAPPDSLPPPSGMPRRAHAVPAPP